MSAGPVGGGPPPNDGSGRVPPRGPLPEEGSSGPIEAAIKKRQFEDRIKEEVEARKKAELKRNIVKYGVPGAIGTAVVFAALMGYAWYKQSREGCGATDDRRRAVKAIMEQGDPDAGTLIGSRFPDRKQFRCADMSDPKGILIAVKEDTGDPIVWFVDQAGTPLNVNLLAASWTPKLGAGPEVGAADIAKVTQ